MSPGLVTVVLFGSMIVLMATGLPVVFALGGVAVLFAFFLWGPESLYIVPLAFYTEGSQVILVAVPLFIFMANMLRVSGLADRLYGVTHIWLGRLGGGLAVATVIVCVFFAAMTGISGAATVSMGLIGIPSMMKRGYDKYIAMGCVAAGGVLGTLIPPSILMILYCSVGKESVGKMFMGGVFPGLLLASFFIIYIIIRCIIYPNLGPKLRREDIPPLKARISSLLNLIPAILLIIGVLGSIYLGICSPTEASAIGALGSIIVAAGLRGLSWKVVKETVYSTAKVCGMCFWLLAAATIFSQLYNALGAPKYMENLLGLLPFGRWGSLIVIQLTLFILGMLMDDYAIVVLIIPLYAPVVRALGFDTLWFGIIFVMNMQMAYLTPPYGFNLFYLRAVVPEGITMGDIYKCVWPFVALQAIGLIIVMIFPQIAVWLPNQMIK